MFLMVTFERAAGAGAADRSASTLTSPQARPRGNALVEPGAGGRGTGQACHAGGGLGEWQLCHQTNIVKSINGKRLNTTRARATRPHSRSTSGGSRWHI